MSPAEAYSTPKKFYVAEIPPSSYDKPEISDDESYIDIKWLAEIEKQVFIRMLTA